MKKLLCLLILICVMSMPVWAQDAAETQEPSPVRACLQQIESYVVYYGEGRVEELTHYDLAIVQPDPYTEEDIATLHAQNTLVVAYLSVGEVAPYQAWYEDGRVKADWMLAENKIWGSFYIDANQTGWQALMIDLMGEYLAKGFDGVFLDTVDTVDEYPETIPGMIALIEGLRAAYPDALLVQNRGFTVAEDTADAVDAVMFEDLSTSYDFDAKRYLRIDNSEDADRMAALKDKTDLLILALDYADAGDLETAQAALVVAQEYGFVLSMSTIALDDIPDYGLEAPRQPTHCASDREDEAANSK